MTMGSSSLTETPAVRDGGPVWPLAELHPEQGRWTAADYLALTDSTNRLIEFTDGRLDFLHMPSIQHQRIVAFLYRLLSAALATDARGDAPGNASGDAPGGAGEVLFAPFRIKLDDGRYREPDLAVMLDQHRDRVKDAFWLGADLVIEVVSPDNPERDWQQKRRNYAEAGIAEYWIVDPQQRRIAVLVLDGEAEYREDRDARPGDTATSRLIPGFSVDVAACFAAAKPR